MIKAREQDGQSFIITLLVIGLVTASTVVIAANSLTYLFGTGHALKQVEAINLAEAGVDKAVVSLNTSGGVYTGEAETFLGSGSYSVTITAINPSTSLVTATGYVPNKTQPVSKKTIKVQVAKGVGASFTYGLQVGNGGIEMGNSSTINGSVYSNGDFEGGNSNHVYGDVYVAGGSQLNPSQRQDCVDPNCLDYLFGKNIGGEARLNVAQSFAPPAAQTLSRISLKLKKTGLPPDLTVRIMGDDGGKPDKNNIITSGIISAPSVGSQYGFIDAALISTPTLNGGQVYWVMLSAASLDSSNYWYWSEDSLQGYNCPPSSCVPAWSANWQQSPDPVWTPIASDLGFKIYGGGVNHLIKLANSSAIHGDAHASSIIGSNLTIYKDAYFQTISGTTVGGVSHPGAADPPPVPFPISEANLADWRNQAESAGVYTGNIASCPSQLGPGKYVGDLTVGNSCTVTVKAPVWITGTFTAGNSLQFNLDPSYGISSGVVLVGSSPSSDGVGTSDGTVRLGNSPTFNGSGTSGSYMFLISTYNSPLYNSKAMEVGNGSVAGVLYAPYGSVELSNGTILNELVAWKIEMGNSTTLNYQTGLSSVFFSSGPQGAFSVIKKTYQSQ